MEIQRNLVECGFEKHGFDFTWENKGDQLGLFNETEGTECTALVGKNHDRSEHWN